MERGVVVSFDAGRGFGFVRSGAFAEDVFVHASAVAGGVSLRPGQRVHFSAEDGPRGLRAVRVEPGRPGLTPAMAAAVGLAVALLAVGIGLLGLGASWPWAWLGAINVITPAVYAWDKRCAGLGHRRVPEAVLLALALAGGTPGAALAMALWRHKTRKLAFRLAFAAVIVAQVVALGFWLRRR
jgi:uncharacterized membrane protein YsdA (DUF1294 family)/cold shock CspA family protein